MEGKMGIVAAFLSLGFVFVTLLVLWNLFSFGKKLRELDHISKVEEQMEIFRLEAALANHPKVKIAKERKELEEAEREFFAQLKARENMHGGLTT